MSDADLSDGEDESAVHSIIAIDSKRHARAQHNALERRRRDNIKDMYAALKDTIPGMKNERASRASVLKKSIDLITVKQAYLEKLLAQNRELELENDALEREIDKIKQVAAKHIPETMSNNSLLRTANADVFRNNWTSGSDVFNAFPKRKRPAPADDLNIVAKNI